MALCPYCESFDKIGTEVALKSQVVMLEERIKAFCEAAGWKPDKILSGTLEDATALGNEVREYFRHHGLHTSPEECPTWYDWCNCGTDTCAVAVTRMFAAEQKLMLYEEKQKGNVDELDCGCGINPENDMPRDCLHCDIDDKCLRR